VQGLGSKFGTASVGFAVVVAVLVEVTCFLPVVFFVVVVTGNVVVVTATNGGWSVWSCAFGGGFVGFSS
jgi:hypothetical protein